MSLARARRLSRGSLISSRGKTGASWEGELPEQPHWEQILKQWRQPTGARSLGSTSRGTLIGAAELALDGAHYSVVSRARARNTRWGSPALVDIIKESAAEVAKVYPDSKLAVGNMSYKGGGDIRWSVSHNSGRDADLAFYVIDERDQSRPIAPDLISFDDDGKPRDKSMGHLRFDVARNWALARALIQSDKAQLQYLFISEGLKAKLLEHARAIEAPEDLITRAQALLRQPTDSSPHDDHFHLRITCTRDDRLLGCTDRGPQWAWVDWYEDDLMARTLAMRPALKSPDVQTRLEALQYLEAIESPYGPELALAWGIYDQDPAVRDAAWRVAGSVYTWSGGAIGLAKRFIRTPGSDLSERARAYRILRKSLDPSVPEFVLAQLYNTNITPRERVMAADALAHHMVPELVPTLIDQLIAQPVPVRAELATILRRITNHAESIDWTIADDQSARLAHGLWTKWWEQHSGLDRQQWLRLGFAQAGLDADTVLTMQGVEPLLGKLLSDQDHLRYNANATLRQITGRWASLEQRDGKKLHSYWSSWWKKNKARLKLTES